MMCKVTVISVLTERSGKKMLLTVLKCQSQLIQWTCLTLSDRISLCPIAIVSDCQCDRSQSDRCESDRYQNDRYQNDRCQSDGCQSVNNQF